MSEDLLRPVRPTIKPPEPEPREDDGTVITYTFTDGSVDVKPLEEAGWYSYVTTASGNPPPAETKIEMEEVDLSTIPLPLCPMCGENTMHFEPVGFCLNPEQPGKIHYFLFKPHCAPCSYFMFDWDDEMLYTTLAGKKAYRFKNE